MKYIKECSSFGRYSGCALLLLVLLAPGAAFSSGFRITNQSVAAVGLAGAHVAYTPGADASFYNPANMSFLVDSWSMEASLTVLHLPEIKYSDNRSQLFNGASSEETFLLPLLHIVSPEVNNFRFGFSLTYPFGLSKQWDQVYPQMTAKNFTLLVVEANPTVSYSFGEKLSIGAGLRLLVSDGSTESLIGNPPASQIDPLNELYRYVQGDTVEYGYNLALSYKPIPEVTIATTYRSEVDMTLEGDAWLQATAGGFPVAQYSGSGSLDVPLPAIFSIGASWTIDELTLEVGWDRTFWSSFKEIDINFDQPLTATPFAAFDVPIPKNWEDSDAFRLGLWYEWNERITTTAGISFEQNPVPDSTLGFELPDSDAVVYSLGVHYRISPTITIGASYMYHHTTSRSVVNEGAGGIPGVDGNFEDGGAHALTAGILATF